MTLRVEERLVADMICHCTGSTWTQWDTAGRQGAFDLLIHGPEGLLTAVEVTSLAGAGEQQLLELLARDDFKWEQPGHWVWGVGVGDVADLPRLRAVFPRLARLCEALGIRRPDTDWRSWTVRDPDLQWLINDSSSEIHSYPELELIDGTGRPRPVYVMPASSGGAVDERLEGLSESIDVALSTAVVQKRVGKVLRATDVDERHLALVNTSLGLPTEQALGLLFDGDTPPGAPTLPNGLDRLWLFPLFSSRILVTDGVAWTQFIRPPQTVTA